MLTQQEIIEKMYEMPERFNQAMREGNYENAYRIYNNAITISVFVDLPEEDRKKLFGNKPYIEDWEEIIDGLFKEADVLKAGDAWIRREVERAEEIKRRREAMGPRIIYRDYLRQRN